MFHLSEAFLCPLRNSLEESNLRVQSVPRETRIVFLVEETILQTIPFRLHSQQNLGESFHSSLRARAETRQCSANEEQQQQRRRQRWRTLLHRFDRRLSPAEALVTRNSTRHALEQDSPRLPLSFSGRERIRSRSDIERFGNRHGQLQYHPEHDSCWSIEKGCIARCATVRFTFLFADSFSRWPIGDSMKVEQSNWVTFIWTIPWSTSKNSSLRKIYCAFLDWWSKRPVACTTDTLPR